MFVLSVAFLIVLGGILHRHQLSDPAQDPEGDPFAALHARELQLQFAVLLILWPFFIADAVLRFWRRDRSLPVWRPLVFALLVCLFPPLRIGVMSPAAPGRIWYPYLGWRVADRDLRRQLEHLFGVPMICIALLVVPLLAIQYGWPHKVREYVGLELFLEVGNGIVWVAFAFEFIVMVSVNERKFTYCYQHWVDLAIIVLPFLQFLPLARALRVGRILRLEQLTRMSRLYRLQGLVIKAYRAVLLLDVIRRLMGRSLESRLRRLEDLLALKQEEVEELRQEIAALKARLAEEQAKAAAAQQAAVPSRVEAAAPSSAPPP
jgi:voltage-gated potassium channel